MNIHVVDWLRNFTADSGVFSQLFSLKRIEVWSSLMKRLTTVVQRKEFHITGKNSHGVAVLDFAGSLRIFMEE